MKCVCKRPYSRGSLAVSILVCPSIEITDPANDKQLQGILTHMSDPNASKQDLNKEIEIWDKSFWKSSNRQVGGGLVMALVLGAVSAYFLHFLYQVKNKCTKVNKAPRLIAEVLMWIQLAFCGVLVLGSLYALLFM